MESDNLLATLLEMGFEEPAAGPVSRSANSLEEAIEAIFRLEIQRGEQQHPYNPSYTQTPLDVEERKESAGDLNFLTSAAITAKLTNYNFQWLSLRMANLDEHGHEIEGGVSIECQPIEFEVLFSSTAHPNHSLLESFTSQELMQIIKNTTNTKSNVSSPNSASTSSAASSTPHSLSDAYDPLHVGLDSTLSNDSIADGANTGGSLTQLEEYQVDKVENDDDETDECVICFDRKRDTLLLPCQHLCICHSCAFDYFSRTCLHNEVLLPASQLQFQSQSDAINSVFSNSLSKSTIHSIRCPTCAIGAEVAVKLAAPSTNQAVNTNNISQQ